MNLLCVLPAGKEPPTQPLEFAPEWTIRHTSPSDIDTAIRTFDPAVVLCVLTTPDIDVVTDIRTAVDETPLVVVTDEPDVDLAVSLSRLRAVEYAPRSSLADAGESLGERLAAATRQCASTDTRPPHHNVADGGTSVEAPSDGVRAVRHGDDSESGVLLGRLDQARTRLAETLERIDDGFFAVDTDWRFTYVNAAAEALLDRSAADLLGENVWEQFPSAISDGFYDQYHRAMRDQVSVSFEEYFEPLDTWFAVSAYPSQDGLSVFFQDITERRERERVRTGVLESTQALMQAESPQAVAETVSEAAVDVLGFDMNVVRLHDSDTDELVPTAGTGDRVDDVPTRPTYSAGTGPAGRAFRTGEPVIVDDLTTYDTHSAYTAPSRGAMAAAMYLPLGAYGMLNVASREPGAFETDDVQTAELLTTVATAALERAERERTLRRYEGILETVRGMVYATDERGELIFVTEPLAEFLGYDPDNVLGKSTNLVIPDDHLPTVRAEIAALDGTSADGTEAFERTASTTRQFEIELSTADGDRVPVEVEVSVLDENVGGRVGIVRDLTDLHSAQKQLRSERDRFSYLFENLTDPVVEVRQNSSGEPTVTTANSAFEDTFGVSPGDAVGCPLRSEHVGPAADRLSALLSTDTDDDLSGGSFDVTTPDGRRRFLLGGVPYTLDGERRAFGILTDVTALARRERHLDVLSRVLRHNLRNRLTVVTGYTDLLAEHVTDPTATEYATVAADAARDLVELSDTARQIESVIGVDSVETVPVRPSNAVRDALDSVDASLSLSVREDAPAVTADDRLSLALSALLENALEHGAEPIDVRVTTPSKETVAIEVRDHGPGLDPVEWEVVSGPREITPLEHGSGLGLWLAKWLAEAYGGELQNRSEQGTTVVSVVLPRAD